RRATRDAGGAAQKGASGAERGKCCAAEDEAHEAGVLSGPRSAKETRMARFPGNDDPPAATAVPAPAPTAEYIRWALIPPLALAQFLSTYANTLINVSMSAITHDLATTVTAVQGAITLFTLIMAMFMITGSKLTDIWGRKRTFLWGIGIFAAGSA